jgi:hypothetical protein
MFRPAEFDALRALIKQRDAVREMQEDSPGQSAEDRELDDVIDEQLTANAWARYTGSGDEGGDDEVIDNLDISEGELGEALLRIRTELRAPAVSGSRTALPARGQLQPTAASRDPQMLGRLERRLRRERRVLRNALATGSVSAALTATGNASDIEDAIGGIAMSAAFGGTLPRRRPATQQRTPHVHALVDSGCNQHL